MAKARASRSAAMFATVPVRQYFGQQSYTMNKWKIAYRVAAILIVMLAFGIITVRGQRRHFLTEASRSIGNDLIASTNSSRLIRIGPDLQSHLAELLSEPTHVAAILFGDEPKSVENG